MASRRPAKGRRKRRWRQRHKPQVSYQKRLRRQRREQARGPTTSSPVWWKHRRLEVASLENGLPDAYPGFKKWRVGGALLYGGEVELDTLKRTRRIVIIFPGHPTKVRPIVMADGPKRSRHRFTWSRPTSLCLWYSGDHKSLRWTPDDRLVGLVDLARLHLIKEAWWRTTGAWPGLEYHRPPTGNEQRSRRPFSRARTKRLDRQACWCGAERYDRCHKTIPVEEELRLLNLA
jgi:hypothetical protein